jgi:hypothetical protein
MLRLGAQCKGVDLGVTIDDALLRRPHFLFMLASKAMEGSDC